MSPTSQRVRLMLNVSGNLQTRHGREIAGLMLQLIVAGQSDRSIAQATGCDRSTVATYRRSLVLQVVSIFQSSTQQ